MWGFLGKKDTPKDNNGDSTGRVDIKANAVADEADVFAERNQEKLLHAPIAVDKHNYFFKGLSKQAESLNFIDILESVEIDTIEPNIIEQTQGIYIINVYSDI